MNLPVPFGSLFELPSVYEDALKLLGYTEKVKTKATPEESNLKSIDNSADSDTLDKHEMRRENKEDERRISPLRETTSESESELESDEDHATIQKKRAPPMPAKRKIQPKHTINKRPRLSQLLQQQQTCMPHQRTSEPSLVKDVFETGESDHEPRKLQLNLRDTVLPGEEAEESHEGSITLQEGGFGKIESLAANDKKKEEESMEEWREKSKYITKEELLSNMVAKAGNVYYNHFESDIFLFIYLLKIRFRLGEDKFPISTWLGNILLLL